MCPFFGSEAIKTYLPQTKPPPQPSPEFRGGSKQTRSPQIVGTKRVFHSVLSPQSSVRLLLATLLLELFLAGRILPTNNLLPPETFESQRFTVSQLLALNEGQTPPGRVLSISDGLFDPGDRAALEARWFDLSPDALQNAFVTVKQRELLAPNLPLLYGIPTIDGFDGGLLPTAYYTAFTSLLLPDGELRTLDGRLREGMASPECRGACVPDQRWLSLTNTRWLLLDKVYDVVHDGVFYDTGIPGGGTLYPNVNDFEATEIRVLYHCADSPCDTTYVSPRGPDFAPADVLATLEGGQIIGRLVLDAPSVLENVSVGNNYAFTVDAVTLVDARTGDFQQLAPDGWRRVLSSDVKLYENLWVSPRAFMVYDAVWTPDTDEGTETALDLMRDPAFDSRREITLAGAGTNMETSLYDVFYSERSVDFHRYTAERVVIVVETELDGYLFLSDAYYPGWRATLDGASVPIYRADVMFRAVFVPAGTHEVVFTYSPY
ncbi:MAG: YfhO family protein [Anaerolinea sp.]|nr:YfhO family protein [Anaerolinea sp.]